MTQTKVTSVKEKERCLCFIRHHNRTQSVPWIIHRQHHTLYNACVCTKWGTELTRKSYSHLSRLHKEKDDDLTKSMLTFECEAVENQLKKSTSPEQLREWWGFFLDPSDAEDDLVVPIASS